MAAAVVLGFLAQTEAVLAVVCGIIIASLLDQGRRLPLSLVVVVMVALVVVVLVAVVPFALSIQEKLERSPLQMWERNKMRISVVAFWRLFGVGT
jgi:O-antigen ligase